MGPGAREGVGTPGMLLGTVQGRFGFTDVDQNEISVPRPCETLSGCHSPVKIQREGLQIPLSARGCSGSVLCV